MVILNMIFSLLHGVDIENCKPRVTYKIGQMSGLSGITLSSTLAQYHDLALKHSTEGFTFLWVALSVTSNVCQ